MKNKKSNFLVGMLAVVVLLLSGCSSAKLAFEASSDINPNIQGVASSTVVYVYQLKDQYAFENASFADLTNDASTLNNSILSRSYYVILPGDDKSITLDIDDQAKYLGFAAGYRNLNVDWKKVIPISKHYYRKSYSIELLKNGIKVED